MLEIDPQFLFEQSRINLKKLILERHTRSANASKRHRALLSEWIEERATVLAMEWLEAHAEEIALGVLDAAPKIIPEVQPDEPIPAVSRTSAYEVLKAIERRARRKTG